MHVSATSRCCRRLQLTRRSPSAPTLGWPDDVQNWRINRRNSYFRWVGSLWAVNHSQFAALPVSYMRKYRSGGSSRQSSSRCSGLENGCREPSLSIFCGRHCLHCRLTNRRRMFHCCRRRRHADSWFGGGAVCLKLRRQRLDRRGVGV